MPVAAHHPLLHAPRIGPDFQHFQIVIRFEQQHLHPPQMNLDRIRHIAEIGRDPDLNAFRVEAEADRIDRIVRNREALDRDIADHPAGARLKMFDRRALRHVLPVNQRRGETRNEDRQRLFLLLRAQRTSRASPEI